MNSKQELIFQKDQIGIGKRKESTARVFLIPGKGNIFINKTPGDKYLQYNDTYLRTVWGPLQKLSLENQFDIVALVNGGGLTGHRGSRGHPHSPQFAPPGFPPPPARRQGPLGGQSAGARGRRLAPLRLQGGQRGHALRLQPGLQPVERYREGLAAGLHDMRQIGREDDPVPGQPGIPIVRLA